MPTFAAVLRILESKRRESPFMSRTKGGGLTDYSRGRQSPSVRRRTSKVSERKRDLAYETMGGSLLSAFRALVCRMSEYTVTF
jgi:hypothetical protein